MEGRKNRKGTPGYGLVGRTRDECPVIRLTNAATKRQRIAELAKQKLEMAFTSLNHLLDLDLLREAFYRTPKDKAPGVDGQTYADYEANLESNLQSLLARVKSGTYRAPPVRRVHIPKGNGNETRPIGIPTLEDKVLQRAVLMLLEPLYEPLFHAGSYGFRPGCSAQDAAGNPGGPWRSDKLTLPCAAKLTLRFAMRGGTR